MSGHRHAASALYGVSAEDQQAVLAALPLADQEILLGHLNELRALGFDAAAMRTIATAAPAAVPVPVQRDVPHNPGPAERIRAASAVTMRSVLAEEPIGLIADVLAIELWPWTQGLVSMLPATRRVQLRLQAARPAPAKPLATMMLSQVALALANLPSPTTDGAHAGETATTDAPGAAPDSSSAGTSRISKLANRWAAWTR